MSDVTQIVRPFQRHDSIPHYSTAELLMPKMCHVAFAHVEPEPEILNVYQARARLGHIAKRVNLDKKYRAMEPQIKALREAGETWWKVSQLLKINYSALQYCKTELGMAKYGEGK